VAGQSLFSRILAGIMLSPVTFLRDVIPFTLLTGGDTNGDTHAHDQRL